MLLGVAHPHKMRVQSILTQEREAEVRTEAEREAAQTDEEEVSEEMEKRRGWGSSDTGNGERKGQKMHWTGTGM